jgi:hypothetical protein
MNDTDSRTFRRLLVVAARGLACVGSCVASLAAVACGGADKPAVAADSVQSQTVRVEKIQHEECKESGNRVDALDTNGDGKPDIRRVYSGSQELCRIVDLNGDGKTDMYEYFDAGGTVRRREFCYDDSGDVNAVEHYEKGRLVSREFDAAGRRRIDTWDTFDPSAPLDPKTGRPAHPVHRERDTTGDGKIDQWWTWNGDKVTIAIDRTGDGKPDPETAIVLGADNSIQTPPPAPDSAVAPASAVPTSAAASSGSGPVASGASGAPPAAPATDGGQK